VTFQQFRGDGPGAGKHLRRVALAIGRMAAIGKIDEVLLGQFGAQGAQDAQPTNPAVEDTDGLAGLHRFSRRTDQAPVTLMPLNSPVAMRFCHSAGPVMWALVPPASTATVTGMSTTSNS
jgi:hypothetical protein